MLPVGLAILFWKMFNALEVKLESLTVLLIKVLVTVDTMKTLE